ncbi:MAG: hypothetical protein ABI707_02855 [Ferruginibacter sp.]
MILQGSLRLKYNGESFDLKVKTFLKNDIYYFFISDKEMGKSLLAGETLELTYSDTFCTDEKNDAVGNQKITAEIITAIENMLLENKSLWFY